MTSLLEKVILNIGFLHRVLGMLIGMMFVVKMCLAFSSGYKWTLSYQQDLWKRC